MELHYKSYQKIRIYLDKIKRALDNLSTIKDRTVLLGWDAPVTYRLEILRLIQAELISFLLSIRNLIPYVPPSRCKALVFWYGSKDLQCPMGISDFYKNIFEADKEVVDETNYILLDEHLPPPITLMFQNHLERLENARQQQLVKENNSAN